MAFETYEISNDDGHPIYLYEFRLGDTYWRYCTSDSDEVLDGVTWTAQAISDDGVRQGGNDQNDLVVQIQADAEVAGLFRNRRPSGKLWLTVRTWHVGDADTNTPV